ncbi:transposase [Streptomyces sp. NBC_00846]|uniref:transposase n=1 Tax=Streptomyces sp. NBC_00846 TaxID=2975849 RepID=UPI00386F80E8
MLVCDGLSALPDAVANVWPQTVVQRCVVHLIRQSLRYASRRDWPEVAADLKPVYTAVNEVQARERLDEFDAKWGHKYGSIATVWQRAWSEFVPFLAFPDSIREVVYTTNSIESPQRSIPPGRHRLRTLPQRTGSAQEDLPGHPRSRPLRMRTQALEQQVEGSAERVRPALRRPPYRRTGIDQSDQPKTTRPKGLKTPKS